MRYKIAIVVSLFFFHLSANAQWEVVSHFSGNSTQGAQVFASSGQVLFVGTSGLGVLKSLDSGRTWITSLDSQGIACLLYDNGDLYAGTSRIGLLRSRDLGATWPDTLKRSGEVKWVARLGQNLLCSIFGGGINLSTNNGANWKTVLDAGFSSIFVTNGQDAYANADKSFYHSSDDGLTWQKMGSIPGGVYDLAMIGNKLFIAAGSAPNMISSVDSGKTWTATSNGIPNNPLLYIHRFGVVGTTLIAGTNQGAYITTDLGANWKSFSTGIIDPYLWPVAPELGYVYSGDTQIIRIPISKVPQGNSAVATTQPLMKLTAYPNPANTDLNITYSLESSALVTINVVDIAGRVVTASRQIANAGGNTYHWIHPEGISGGIYNCLIITNGKTQAVKFVVE